MEQWLPLMEIFTSSPCPVGEASMYVETRLKRRDPLAASLWRLVPDLLSQTVPFHTQNDDENHEGFQVGKCMWIETLSSSIQCSLLTFLTSQHHRFNKKDLRNLASNLLDSPHVDFRVRIAADNLLHSVTGLTSIEGKDQDMKEFVSLPEWLQDCKDDSSSLFPWLPMSCFDYGESAAAETKEDELNDTVSNIRSLKRKKESSGSVGVVAGKSSEEQNETSCVSKEIVTSGEVAPEITYLSSEIYAQAVNLRAELLSSDSDGDVSGFADRIKELCANSDSREVLSIIKPWDVDDEVTMKLVGNLMVVQDGYAWSTDILCSLVLPKLLFLEKPASRLLTDAALQAGKIHQRATVDGLLIPLLLNKQRPNVAVCEALKRVVADCLSKEQVSSFLEKIPFEENHSSVVCLPCHQSQISSSLVWSEPVFSLFQDILNKHPSLRQEAIDNLALGLGSLNDDFAKSLKFGNFLLCLVSKHSYGLKCHKFMIENVAKWTSTFMTKTILSKLANL